jgi:hypothetical protein
MLVELIVLVIEQKTVLSFIPICSLKITSRAIPKINKTEPIHTDIFKYFVVSISFLNNWESIKNNPKRQKNIMSFPLDDPIKNVYVKGLIIGLKISVRNIIPPNKININPTMIVLLTFINNILILIL